MKTEVIGSMGFTEDQLRFLIEISRMFQTGQAEIVRNFLFDVIEYMWKKDKSRVYLRFTLKIELIEEIKKKSVKK